MKYRTEIHSVLVDEDDRTLEEMRAEAAKEAANMDREVGTTTTVAVEIVEE